MIDEKIDTECFKELERLRELRISHRDLDYLIDSLEGVRKAAALLQRVLMRAPPSYANPVV